MKLFDYVTAQIVCCKQIYVTKNWKKKTYQALNFVIQIGFQQIHLNCKRANLDMSITKRREKNSTLL